MSRRVAALIPLALLLAWALYVFSPLVADPDLWGHLRFGRDTLLTGHIVRPDPYSYLTANQPWINHEWLTEVVYAFAYKLAGPNGLITLNLLLSLSMVGLIHARLVRRGMGRFGAALLTAGICLVLRAGVLNVRPQVFTYFLFLLLLLLIDAYTRAKVEPPAISGTVFVAAVSLLFALWVNLHGGVLAGVAVLYLWGAVFLIETVARNRSLTILARPRLWGVIAALVLAPAALLINPYGPGLLAFLLRTATVSRTEIVEWQGVRLDNPWGWYWLATVGLTAAVVALSRRPRRLPVLIPLAVIALLPLSAFRHIPLVAVAAPVLAADHFSDLWARIVRASRVKDLSGLANLTGLRLLPLIPAALLLWVAAPRLQEGIQVLPASANFPVRAVAVLQAAGLGGNMATEFNWGEYVIWHLGPQIRVSVDGRRETVYSEAVYRENLDFMQGQGQWDRLVDRPETNLALVDRGRPAYALMRRKAGWQLAYEDTAAALFVRGDAAPALDTSRIPTAWPADGAGLAFPVE